MGLHINVWENLIEIFAVEDYSVTTFFLRMAKSSIYKKIQPSKILQARLKHIWTMSFQMFKGDLEKAEEPEIKLPTSVGSQKNFQ